MSGADDSNSPSWNKKDVKENHACQNSDSSDTDDEVTLPSSFSRKISTNKRLNKAVCLKEGYLQILRTTSFHKWKRRYFWLKGKTLFFGRDNQADIYEEIDLTEASVAEYTLKNDNHAFQVISAFRNIVLATDSRKDMEAWIQCILSASQKKIYDPNDQQSMISGQHSWYITSHARPVYCNVCREPLSGVTSHGLSCSVCRLKAHKKCAVRASNNCKWSTLASVGDHIIEDGDNSLSMEHQWLEGNLPVSSHCSVCDRKCGSVRRLQDFRCLWCKATVHSSCKDSMSRSCSIAQCQYSVLSPLNIHSIDSDGLCEASNCRGLSPLLVFVNSKSGDNQGVKFLRKFKQLLNPAQVFDLMNGGPFPGLRLFQNFDQFRILVCGGDGSVSWVMSEVDNLNLHPKCQIGVLPLGTGNDLARVLGWGSVMSDDNQVTNAIDRLEQAQIKMLDRWSIMTFEWKQTEFDIMQTGEFGGESTDDSSLHMPNNDFNEELSSTPTYESTMAECLHKILNSTDYLTVINYSKSLCAIVSQFLSQLYSLQQISDPNIKSLDSGSLGEKCHELQAKLNHLMDALNQSNILMGDDSSENGLPSDMLSVNESKSDTQTEVPEIPQTCDTKEKSTQVLMSRANSVKKAIKQIMDHTEAAVNLTIHGEEGLAHASSTTEIHSNSSEQFNTRAQDLEIKEEGLMEDLCPKEVTFNLDINPATPPECTIPLPAASSPAMTSPSRKISSVSAYASDSQTEISFPQKPSVVPQKPSTSLRVRNAIASKMDGHGSFIGKMLLANADAVCAAVVPPFNDQSIQSEFQEKYAMNNYFGIGIDAKIALEFHQQREHHPERFRSRAKNLMTFASLGGKELITRTYRNFEKRILLECDGQQLPLPNLQGIVVQNIPSYSCGTNFWGTHKPGSSEPFTAPSYDDKILEVMAVYSSAHIGVSRFVNLHYHRIAQCRTVKITILGNGPVPIQVDGEAWMQNPGFIKIRHKNRAQMLTRDRSFEHALKSWSERQSREKYTPVTSLNAHPDTTGSHSTESLNTSSSSSEHHMQALVSATRQLVECLTSLNFDNISPNEGALSKCGEFISLDDATQAGLHELSICSTELCLEVQEIINNQSGNTSDSGIGVEDDGLTQLRTALSKTQKELEKFNSTSGTRHHGKYRQGPFRLIGKLLGRYKKQSSNYSHQGKSPKASRSTFPHSDIPVEQWSAEVVTSWLQSIGLEEYSQIFIRNDIRGYELLHLQRTDLKELGISKVGHLRRFQTALKSLEITGDHASSLHSNSSTS